MPTSPVRRAVVAAAGSLLVALTVLPTGGSSLAGPALPGGAARTTTEPTPAAAARFVVSTIDAKSTPAAFSVLPALNPNHPNQSTSTPAIASGML